MKVVVCVCLMLLIGTSTVNACGEFLHASCELYWVISNAPCQTVLKFFAQQFQDCCADKDIGANYTGYTLTNFDNTNLIVSGSILFKDGYIDDQTITLTQDGNNCNADACSQSESVSYYDYCANYCDVHNLIRGIPFTWNETIGTCRFHPDNGQQDSYCNGQ